MASRIGFRLFLRSVGCIPPRRNLRIHTAMDEAFSSISRSGAVSTLWLHLMNYLYIMEQEHLYFRGLADGFAYLKKIGAFKTE